VEEGLEEDLGEAAMGHPVLRGTARTRQRDRPERGRRWRCERRRHDLERGRQPRRGNIYVVVV